MSKVTCHKEYTLTVNDGVPAPFAYYKFDSWDGVAAVDSISARNMPLFSGVDPVIVPGIISNGYNLSGSRLRLVDAGFDFAGQDFTVRFWFKTNNAASNGRPLEGFASGPTSGTWFFRYDPSTGLFWGMFNDTESPSVNSGPLTVGTYHHVVAWVKAGVEIGLKIDNVLIGTSAITGSLGPGVDTWSFPFLLGLPAGVMLIDEIAVWKGQALSAEQITLDYAGGAGRTWPW